MAKQSAVQVFSDEAFPLQAVTGTIIAGAVETKTGLPFNPLAPIQLLNYLCAARLTLGLVIHFGPAGAKARRVVSTDQPRSVARRS